MFSFIAQDPDGFIFMYSHDVTITPESEGWLETLDTVASNATLFFEGTHNPNWRNTKINLMVDNFKIEDGILTRTTLKADPEPVPAQAPLPEGTYDHTEMRSAWEARGKPFDIEYWTSVCGWTKIRHPSWQASLKYRVAE